MQLQVGTCHRGKWHQGSLPDCRLVLNPSGNTQMVFPRAVESKQASRAFVLRAQSLWPDMEAVPWPQKWCIQHKPLTSPQWEERSKYSPALRSIWGGQEVFQHPVSPEAKSLWECTAVTTQTHVPITVLAAHWHSFLILTGRNTLKKYQILRGTKLREFIPSRQLSMKSCPAVACSMVALMGHGRCPWNWTGGAKWCFQAAKILYYPHRGCCIQTTH